MAASERFSLLIQSQTTGSAEVQKLQETFEKLIGTVDKTAQKTRQIGEGAKFENFADGIKNFIQNPLQGAGDAVGGFVRTLGPMGVAVASSVGIMGLLAKTGFDNAKALGEYGDRIEDISIRTGLGAKEVEQFTFAMRRAGGDISSVEGMMRKLSQGLADNSAEGKAAREGLVQLGIKARDSEGNLRPMSAVLLEISAGLGKMEGTANRNALAIKIMGRSALEALPDLLELSEGVKRAKELGLGPSDKDLARWKDYQQNIVEIETAWEKLKRALKEPLAAQVVIAIKSDYMPTAPGGVYVPQRTGAAVSNYEEAMFEFLDLHGWSESRSGQRAKVASVARTKADQAAYRERFGGTKAGLEESIRTSRTKAESAREAYLGYEGPENDNWAKLKRDVGEAEAALAKYEARLKSINEQEALAKKWGTFEFKEPNNPLYPRVMPSLLTGPSGKPYPSTMGAPALVISQAAMDKASEATDKARLERALAYAAGSADAEKFRFDRAESARKSESDHRLRMVELLAGPGGEVAAVEKIYSIRIAEARTAEELRSAEMDHEQRIAEIRRRRMDEWRQTLGSVFDATLAGPEGLRGLATGYLKATARTMFQNLGTEFLKPGQFEIPGQGSADKPNLLGKILQGTPFGLDPLKTATDANTLATVENTLAIRAMSFSSGAGGALSSMRFGTADVIAAAGGAGGGGTVDLSGYYASMGLKSPTRNAGLYKGIGVAAALAGGTYGAYEGFKAGGAQGGLTGSASIVGAAGMLLPMLSNSLKFMGPVGLIAGMGLGIAAALMGNPKEKRAEALTAEAERRRFTEPTGADYLSDAYGRNVDYDYRGGVRVYKSVYINAPINALDAGSFKDFSRDHATEFGLAVTNAISSGNAEDLVGTLRQVM